MVEGGGTGFGKPGRSTHLAQLSFCCCGCFGPAQRVYTRYESSAQVSSTFEVLLPTHNLSVACTFHLCRSYISDITTSQCRQLLKKEAAGSLFDVVLHDGAPNVGGAWSTELYTQVW